MPGFRPGIHVLTPRNDQRRGWPDKPGHTADQKNWRLCPNKQRFCPSYSSPGALGLCCKNFYKCAPLNGYLALAILTITTTCIGSTWGLHFKVFALIPAIVSGFPAILVVGIVYADSAWTALLVAFLNTTALQLGYLAGAVVCHCVANSRARKDIAGSRGTTDTERFSRGL